MIDLLAKVEGSFEEYKALRQEMDDLYRSIEGGSPLYAMDVISQINVILVFAEASLSKYYERVSEYGYVDVSEEALVTACEFWHNEASVCALATDVMLDYYTLLGEHAEQALSAMVPDEEEAVEEEICEVCEYTQLILVEDRTKTIIDMIVSNLGDVDYIQKDENMQNAYLDALDALYYIARMASEDLGN